MKYDVLMDGDESKWPTEQDLIEWESNCARRPGGYFLFFNVVRPDNASALGDALELVVAKPPSADELAAKAAGLGKVHQDGLPESMKAIFGMACGFESLAHLGGERKQHFWQRLAALLPPQSELRDLLAQCRVGGIVIWHSATIVNPGLEFNTGWGMSEMH